MSDWITAIAAHAAAHVDGLIFDPTGTTGTLFIATMPSTPDLAVMLNPVGGLQQPDLTAERIPTPQFIVRSTPQDPRPGFALASRLLEVFDGLGAGTLDPDGVALPIVGCTALQSAPVAMGMDDNRRHEWSLNFTLRIWQPSELRPA